MELDITRFLGATNRGLTSRDFQGKPARVVTITRTFATDQDNLWDALTNPERIPTWFLPIEGGVNPGERYQLIGNAEGEVLLCQPQDHFEITWEFAGTISWVHVTLTPAETGTGTDFKLEHIAQITEDDSFWDQYGPGAGGVGWELGLLGLHLHLQSGNANNAQEFENWTMSPEGKKFITVSSEAWGQASIQGGTPQEAALAAAANTTAFYTGEPQPES